MSEATDQAVTALSTASVAVIEKLGHNNFRSGFGILGMEIALGVVFFLGLYVMYGLHKNPNSKFKFEDFFMKDGKASVTPMAQLVSLGASAWGFVYILQSIAITEELAKYYLFGFMAIWSGSKIIDKALDLWFDRRKRNQEVSQERRAGELPPDKGTPEPDKVVVSTETTVSMPGQQPQQP